MRVHRTLTFWRLFVGRHYVTWVLSGIGLTRLERFRFWLTCTCDVEGQNCCCPSCCSCCRDEYLDLKLTPEYAAAKLASLTQSARSALRFLRGLLFVGCGLGIAGVFFPSIMNHPDRVAAAGLAVMSALGLWNFSLIQDEDNER